MWIPSRLGIDERSVPRDACPFDATIFGEGVYQVLDAALNPRLQPRRHPARRLPSPLLRWRSRCSHRSTGVRSALRPRRASAQLTDQQLGAGDILGHQVVNRLELNVRIRQMDRAARVRQCVESALTVGCNCSSAGLDTVGALVLVYDTAGRIVRFNRACEAISGYHSIDLVGRYVWDQLIPEDDVQEAIATFDRISAGSFPATFENHWQSADGSLRRIAWSATALLDGQNQVVFVIATGIDVTVESAAEDTLRESEARYRQLVESSLGVVCTHDLNGNILSINTHGAQSLGRSINDMVSHPLTEFMPEERRKTLPAYLRQISSTGEATGSSAPLPPQR